MANNAVQPDKAKPIIEPVGEGREPERDFEVADQFTAKISEYGDIADLFAARADNLFKENQKRAKALGAKGWDKTSALYRQWYNTTQVVKLADKIANIYKKGTEAADAELTQAEEMEKELDDTRMALDLTRAEAWDESDAAKELTNRWSGAKLPEKQSAEKLIKDILPDLRKEAKTDDADRESAAKELKNRWAGTETPKAKSAAELVSDIYLSESSVNKDKFALEQRRAAEKNANEQAALKKQIELAKKEAERITAEQKEQAKVDKYEKSIVGPAGWFKRLFKGKEQRAAEKSAAEKAELTRAAVEADAALERPWTKDDEEKQERQILTPGIVHRVLTKAENAVINAQARGIDKKLDKKLAREKAAAADLEDWKEVVDESVAKRGLVDKVLSRMEPTAERQGERMMKKMEKAEAKEAATLKRWGEKATAEMNRPWSAAAEREQEKRILKPGLINRVLGKAENAITDMKARGIDKKLDKKLAKEKAAAADLENWQEEVDESVAKRGLVDKVLSKFERDPEKVAAKKLAKLDATEAKAKAEAEELERWEPDEKIADVIDVKSRQAKRPAKPADSAERKDIAA